MPKMSVAQESDRLSMKHPITRRDFLSTSLKAGAAAFTTGLLPKRTADAQGQYNVLFFLIDDLRPLLGCYGHSEMHTPNIDRLAQRGTLFNRAYCQFPICNPSRASILTGLRPETNGVLNNRTFFRDAMPNVVTFPQHFKNHGYYTRAIGKIEHERTALDNELLWSTPAWLPRRTPLSKNLSWQALDVDDDELRDGKAAKRAVEVLEDIKDLQFLLAVGFRKPHLPFNAPIKYFELYDTQFTENVPDIIISPVNEGRFYSDIPSEGGPISKEKALGLIRAYAASTSYMDAQVGRVLDQLDALGLTENTVIVLAGDHGFHLGEHGKFAKRTIFEVALHSPLIVSFPGQSLRGTETNALVELVDIYPTLCDLCQLPILSELEGISMVPVIEEPARSWKTAAFSQVDVNPAHSIRTERYRYTERRKTRELYDYYTDPEGTINIANLPENAELVEHLSERLHAGWQAALPNGQEQILVPLKLPWDINNDGIVNLQDLLVIADSFGAGNPENLKVDVNKDGNVDIVDLLLVAVHLGESTSPEAPGTKNKVLPTHLARVNKWIVDARLVDDGSNIFKRGIAALEGLISDFTPEKTTLLPNYPNPFNPETWIPYDLAEAAHVLITISNLKGESVKQLKVGFQAAGIYRTQSRAAYWDGCNAMGEPVVSGIYFYTLQAGQVRVSRKMVIAR